jgi:cysteine-rich repeat protein
MDERLTRFLGALTLGAVLLPSPASATTANDLCAPAADPCLVGTAVTITNGSVIDVGGRELRVTSTGNMNVADGTMTIVAGTLTVQSGGQLRAAGSGSLAGGSIAVTAGAANIAGIVDARGSPGGSVTFDLAGAAEISGQIRASALSRDESGGTIRVDAASAVVSGQLASTGGTEDSLGGDVEVDTAGNLMFSGEIDVSGPDGGSVILEAGALGGAGNLTLAASASINADGENQGGFGGTVDLMATGDGIATGLVALAGAVTADGATAGEDVGGGSGGCINVTASGQISSAKDPVSGKDIVADLGVKGGGPDGDGGELEIVSDRGGYTASAVLDVSADGTDGGGGAVSIDTALDIELRSDIDATAGDGGDVSVSSAQAGVSVLEKVSIDVGGRSGGTGGGICLESAPLDRGNPATVLVLGELLAVGGNAAEGGVIEIDGLDSVRVADVGRVVADGGSGGGFGNVIAIRVGAGPALIEGTLSARGNQREGGIVSVDARRINVSGRIDVRGSGAVDTLADSMIGLRATGGVDITGVLDASSSPGSGGLVEIKADGKVVLSGTLTGDGGASPGGEVAVTGCDILVCGLNSPECPAGATGLIRTNGPDGTNRLVGRESIAVLGNMQASQSGRNLLVSRPGQPAPVVLGMVVPTRILSVDASLVSCVVCGNNVIEPPETCDDGNTEDGDGCSASCELETAPPGDVNGDATVNAEDIRFLIAEIFDGDGDSVTMVSRGSFPGTPGADVNGDRRIGAADLPGLLIILGGG